MPRLIFRVSMFLSSYAPLFALLAFTSRDTPKVWKPLLIVTIGSIVLLVVVMAVIGKSGDGPRITVKHSRPQDGEVLAYVATYLIPFFSLDLAQSDDIVVFCGFVAVLMVVYINSSMLFVNPLLSIAGYHSFEVEDGDGHAYRVLARRKDIEPGTTIRPAQVDRYNRVEVRRDSSG